VLNSISPRTVLTVELLFAGVGSGTDAGVAMVAVFTSGEGVPAASVPVAVKVAVPPASRVTDAATLPLPLAGQVDPAEAEQVQPTPVSPAGKLSFTVAPVTATGPLFVAERV
jgi:hypothetical protein